MLMSHWFYPKELFHILFSTFTGIQLRLYFHALNSTDLELETMEFFTANVNSLSSIIYIIITFSWREQWSECSVSSGFIVFRDISSWRRGVFSSVCYCPALRRVQDRELNPTANTVKQTVVFCQHLPADWTYQSLKSLSISRLQTVLSFTSVNKKKLTVEKLQQCTISTLTLFQKPQGCRCDSCLAVSELICF